MDEDLDLTGFDVMQEFQAKSAVLKVAPSVVSVVSCNLPDEMTRDEKRWYNDRSERAYGVSGIVVECVADDDSTGRTRDHGYSATILTTAVPFSRTNGIPPNKVEVDIYLNSNKLHKGKVVACDFHNNLALVKIKCDSPLECVKLTGVDEDLFEANVEESIRFKSRSELFSIQPGDEIIALRRRFHDPHPIRYSHGFYSWDRAGLDCKELRSAGSDLFDFDGGPIINYDAQVIGIVLCDESFLPANIVIRWLKYFKKTGNFRRPCLGLEVSDVHAASIDFLEQLKIKFPESFQGVLVTKVEHDSTAASSVMRPLDIILRCDGTPVSSALEFYESVWDKESDDEVEFDVLRVNVGKPFKLSIKISDASEDQFHQWPLPEWFTRYDRTNDKSKSLNQSASRNILDVLTSAIRSLWSR